MLLSLAACGGKVSDGKSGGEPDPNAGKYQGISAKALGMTMDMSEVYPGETWVELKSGGKYTFTMPASNVTVKATFMEDNAMLNFFVDVPADAYYYDAVLWAVENGITKGTSDTTLTTDADCTRAQIVTFIYRALADK